MASMVAETRLITNGDDGSNGVEISKFNSDLLISLLEESHGEEYNDEQVNRAIQSLEAEINANMLEAGHDLAMELEFLDDEYVQNCLASMEFEWAEMEMVPSAPSDDMNWGMDQCENELDFKFEHGFSSEENGFSSLCNETYETVAHI